jgi:hypothetical protein
MKQGQATNAPQPQHSSTVVPVNLDETRTVSKVVPPYPLSQYPRFTTGQKKDWKIIEIKGS